MAIICTRCEGTGFINNDQLPDGLLREGCDAVIKWMKETRDNDVAICDCCGDGGNWYGEPGYHYTISDPSGPHGPYAYNGGLCPCH